VWILVTLFDSPTNISKESTYSTANSTCPCGELLIIVSSFSNSQISSRFHFKWMIIDHVTFCWHYKSSRRLLVINSHYTSQQKINLLRYSNRYSLRLDIEWGMMMITSFVLRINTSLKDEIVYIKDLHLRLSATLIYTWHIQHSTSYKAHC
jgi:hypothetical protein